jgi:hypothetical protein
MPSDDEHPPRNSPSRDDQAAVQRLLEKVLTETLLYRPDRPLEFAAQYLDELCGDTTETTKAFRRLVSAQRTPDQFLDECAAVYAAMAAQSASAPYCGRDDCARLAKACAVDMPEHVSDMFVERIESSCGEIIDFERFSSICRVCVDCRGVTRDCRDAWHLLEPGRPDAVIDREDLLRIAPQLVLPNRSSFTLDEVLEAVVESMEIDTTPGEDVGTYDSFLRKSVT